MTDQNSQNTDEQRIVEFKNKFELLLNRVRTHQEDSRWTFPYFFSIMKDVEDLLSEFMQTDFPMSMLPCEIERVKEIYEENQRLKHQNQRMRHQIQLYSAACAAACKTTLEQIKYLSSSCESFIEKAAGLEQLIGQSMGNELEKMVENKFLEQLISTDDAGKNA